MDWLRSWFNVDDRAAWLEGGLKKAILAADQKKTISLFRQLFILLLREELAGHLATLVLTYGSEIEKVAQFDTVFSPELLRSAIALLETRRLDMAALRLCSYCGYEEEGIDLLAKRGRANDLAAQFMKGDVVDKALLATAIRAWERYNADLRKSQTMKHVLTRIGEFAAESLPAQPRVMEAAGRFEEAAALYEEHGDLADAARCYEIAERYAEAAKLYKGSGDMEAASRAAEAAGDLEEALRLVVNSERRFGLLLRMDRLVEAREFAAGLEHPNEALDLVKDRARELVEIRVRCDDVSGAMELVELAEWGTAEREEFLERGLGSLDRQLASAASEEDVHALVREKIKLLERARHFEEAGKLAEEVLEDLDLASRLYERADLYDKAIGAASDNLRLAELHEKGGNRLEAARLYELAGEYDRAFALYESLRNYARALECYEKTAHPSQPTLRRLYEGAGEYQRLVESHIDSGTFPDLEKALSLATAHGLTSHARVIRERMGALVSGSEADLTKCFEQASSEVLGSYSPILGIDFGTTNSVVALFNRSSQRVETVPDARGLAYQPSFFGVDERGRPIFGEAARLRSLTAPECAVARVKRSLGERVTFPVRGKQYRCEQVVAWLLQDLRSNALAYLQARVETMFRELLERGGLRFPADVLAEFLDKQKKVGGFGDVVLSVPAYFNDNQKRATRDSAEIAGLQVRRLLHEPTAAALAYSYQKAYTGKLAVIDLGGGTLDISILEIGEGVNDVLTVGGDPKLGGSDIDAILVDHVLKDISARWGIQAEETIPQAELSRLRAACEDLKIDLSSTRERLLDLPYFLNRPKYALSLTRAELEQLSRPVLDRIQATIRETIGQYGSGIDNYILVGNATKMPAVRSMVGRMMRARELRGIDPGSVVASGAALEGSILCGDQTQVLLLDVVPYSLGIVVSPETGGELIQRLIEKDTTIPASRSGVYTTKADNQPNVHIRVYQGESPEPHKNYYLGDFILDGIPPAPAHTPQIEVTFDIGADCILTVKAVDKGTGNERSIRIERSVLLSPQEKADLYEYFAQREKSLALESDLDRLRREITALRQSCENALQSAERLIQDFRTQFRQKVEVNPHLYDVDRGKIPALQDMIMERAPFLQGVPRYRDQFASAIGNLERIEAKHLDYGDADIAARLRERIDELSNGKRALRSIIESVEIRVTGVVAGWIQLLESMEPDPRKMSAVELANHYLAAGRADKAREGLESLASGAEGLTKEAFELLLKCYGALGLKEEHHDAHSRFGRLFGGLYPDRNRLDLFLRAVQESVFLIYGGSPQRISSGTGFCFAPNLVATNRHVVEGMAVQEIQVIGTDAVFTVERLELDPVNDLAVLQISEPLKPLRRGEFGFVAPGDCVLTIGFPHPTSNVHRENIYISSGIVNSIRRVETSPERVIYIDTKIGAGMSGAPLINDLGEVVGIVTGSRLGRIPTEQGPIVTEDQPVALPIYLVDKYL